MKYVLLLLLTSAFVQAVQVKLTWDAPVPSPEPPVVPYTYNLYQVSPDNPVPGSTIYIRMNAVPITVTEMTLQVQHGQKYVVRSFDGTFESIDSNMLTIPNAPPPPSGLKITVLKIESSNNLKDWYQIALLPVSKDDARKFYRIAWNQ